MATSKYLFQSHYPCIFQSSRLVFHSTFQFLHPFLTQYHLELEGLHLIHQFDREAFQFQFGFFPVI